MDAPGHCGEDDSTTKGLPAQAQAVALVALSHFGNLKIAVVICGELNRFGTVEEMEEWGGYFRAKKSRRAVPSESERV
jgi:hypothetical protein